MKIGDLVHLNSGGQSMTVEAVGPDEQQFLSEGMVRCVWMAYGPDGKYGLQVRVFRRETLDAPLPEATASTLLS